MATKKEDTVYLRNKRPNRIVFHYAGTRYPLSHRGSREDSIALPIDALSDQNITRWINIGQLEKISQEDFIALGRRRVDVLPNAYLKQPVRGGTRSKGVPMVMTSADSGDVSNADVHQSVRSAVSPEWAGDLMTTEEELEEFNYDQQNEENYPSRHRGNSEEVRRQMGY